MKFFKRIEVVVTGLTLFVLAAATAVYLAMPQPPPKVSIEFQGCLPGENAITLNGEWPTSPAPTNFPPEQTNVYCKFCLVNHSSATINWIPREYKVEAKTPTGWVTNVFDDTFFHASVITPSSKHYFKIYVPMNSKEWRVTGACYYPERHDLQLNFIGWVVDKNEEFGNPTKDPTKIIDGSIMAIDWLLWLLPKPGTLKENVQSELFTNPPQAIILPASVSP